MSVKVVEPAERWNQVIGLLQTDDNPGDAGAIMTEDSGERLFEQLATQAETVARNMGAPTSLIELIRQISDAANMHGQMVSNNAYSVGWGDGWHAGALAVLRLIGAGAGISVPAASGAFAFLLGIPGPPLRTATHRGVTHRIPFSA